VFLLCCDSETLDGLSTIRAFQGEQRFRARNNRLLDANQQAYFLNFSANCWLAVRLELAGTMIVTLAALLAVIAKSYQGIFVICRCSCLHDL
jgi:ATP-binding cassette subfamily C (CFTR/MRP) protein 1